MNTPIDLNRVSFFKPIVGKTLREQLRGRRLAGTEVVEYLYSLDGVKDFVPPNHWDKPHGDANHGGLWIYGFSLTYLRPRYHNRPKMVQEPVINGFIWTEGDEFFGPHFGHHYRGFTGDPLNMMVSERHDWCPQDWILIES